MLVVGVFTNNHHRCGHQCTATTRERMRASVVDGGAGGGGGTSVLFGCFTCVAWCCRSRRAWYGGLCALDYCEKCKVATNQVWHSGYSVQTCMSFNLVEKEKSTNSTQTHDARDSRGARVVFQSGIFTSRTLCAASRGQTRNMHHSRARPLTVVTESTATVTVTVVDRQNCVCRF